MLAFLYKSTDECKVASLRPLQSFVSHDAVERTLAVYMVTISDMLLVCVWLYKIIAVKSCIQTEIGVKVVSSL